jgi:hypothetical protein
MRQVITLHSADNRLEYALPKLSVQCNYISREREREIERERAVRNFSFVVSDMAMFMTLLSVSSKF